MTFLSSMSVAGYSVASLYVFSSEVFHTLLDVIIGIHDNNA